MMNRESILKWKTRISGDLSGALSAAIITMPMAIGYGIIAFAPLGTDFIPQAAMAGIFSAVFAEFLASLLGGSPIQITGPKAPLTLIYGTFISSTASMLAATGHAQPAAPVIIGLASLCLLVAGVSQIGFGLLNIGNLIKDVPQPVIAGFMNGIAFLLITKQMRIIFGFESGQPLWKAFKQPLLINPLTTVGDHDDRFFVKKVFKKGSSLISSHGGGYRLILYFIICFWLQHERRRDRHHTCPVARLFDVSSLVK